MSEGTHWILKLEKNPDERTHNSMRPDLRVWFDPEDGDECITLSASASVGHTQRYIMMSVDETKKLIGFLEASIAEALEHKKESVTA